MKRFHYVLWVCVFLLMCLDYACIGQSEGAKPEKVYRIVYEVRPNEWYVEQAKLWKKEIEKNPKNPEAWYNYYNANRYARFVETIDTKEKKARLEKIIEDMGQAIPGTYEYYLLKFWNSYSLIDVSVLQQAYELAPERVDTYYGFITHYEFTDQEKKLKEFCEKLYKSKDIAPNLVDYNYNVLMSIEKNAILFTNGDNDTYPIWVLQQAKGIREDVTLLNQSIIRAGNEYLERKLKEKGIRIDLGKLPESKEKEFLTELTKTLGEKYPDIPIYFALTVYEKHIESIMDDLYIVGLAYQYSPERIDNLALLKKNLERNLRLDYLKHDWYDDSYLATSLVTHMNLNYIAPMIMLTEHYKASGEDGRAQQWKNFALDLARKAGKEEMVEEIEKKCL
ncbi:MAG: hypothetical protein AMJ91_00590 [candidate division Zixibacteria bacterium SM23_73_3]|nr:MAG: hypothetical protein AMJ91_00590 [candidate division Zixibacteria bacterium SM23_73_3]